LEEHLVTANLSGPQVLHFRYLPCRDQGDHRPDGHRRIDRYKWPSRYGKPHSVRYEAVNAMLLNEFLKEHRKVEQQAGQSNNSNVGWPNWSGRLRSCDIRYNRRTKHPTRARVGGAHHVATPSSR